MNLYMAINALEMTWHTCTGALAFLPGMSATFETAKECLWRALSLCFEAQIVLKPVLGIWNGMLNSRCTSRLSAPAKLPADCCSNTLQIGPHQALSSPYN